jgi:hypothetical protein
MCCFFRSKSLPKSSNKDIGWVLKVQTEWHFSCDQSRTLKYIDWLMWILGAKFRLRLLKYHSMKHDRRQPHVVKDGAWLNWEWSVQ